MMKSEDGPKAGRVAAKALSGWTALAALNKDGSITTGPTTLKDVQTAYKARVRLTLRCRMDGTLVALVLLTPSGFLFVCSNANAGDVKRAAADPEMIDGDAWTPVPTLLRQGWTAPLIYCPKCNSQRGPVPDLLVAVKSATRRQTIKV